MCPAIIGEFLEDLVSRSIYSLLLKYPLKLPTLGYVNILYLYRSAVVLLQYGGKLAFANCFDILWIASPEKTAHLLLCAQSRGGRERIEVCEGWGIVQCTYIISILIATGKRLIAMHT